MYIAPPNLPDLILQGEFVSNKHSRLSRPSQDFDDVLFLKLDGEYMSF